MGRHLYSVFGGIPTLIGHLLFVVVVVVIKHLFFLVYIQVLIF